MFSKPLASIFHGVVSQCLFAYVISMWQEIYSDLGVWPLPDTEPTAVNQNYWQNACFDSGSWSVMSPQQPLTSVPLQIASTSSPQRNESYVQRKMRQQEERSLARRQMNTVSSYVCDFLYFCCIKLTNSAL